MKYIIAMINPARITAVLKALSDVGVEDGIAVEVRGNGIQGGGTETYRGAGYDVALKPKVRLEIAVHRDNEAIAFQAIRQAAASGSIGDGKIFSLLLEDAIQIGSGARGAHIL